MELDVIYNEDCFEGMRKIPDKSLDVGFTSPPYNRIRNDTYEHFDDVSSDYFGMLTKTTNEMLRICKKQVVINIQMNHFNKQDVCKFIGHYASNIKGIVIWNKTNPQPSTNYRKSDEIYSITNAYEYFFVLGDDGNEFRANEKIRNVITTSINSDHIKGHGAVMKKEVCEFFIKEFTKPDDVVLDPFLGTGTTAVCCVENNRHYIGFEIAPEYFDIACQRLDEAEEKAEGMKSDAIL